MFVFFVRTTWFGTEQSKKQPVEKLSTGKNDVKQGVPFMFGSSYPQAKRHKNKVIHMSCGKLLSYPQDVRKMKHQSKIHILSKSNQNRRKHQCFQQLQGFYRFKYARKYILLLHFTSKCVQDDPKPQCLPFLHIDNKSRPFAIAAE